MLSTILSFYITSVLNPFSVSNSFNIGANEVLTAETIPIQNTSQEQAPSLQASGIIAVDLNSGTVLYEKNADARLQIASVTKLMTATLILEQNNLNDIVTVSKNAASADGSKIWLYPNEKLSVQSLVQAALIHSANDAAYALAEHNAGSVKNFVDKMNDKVAGLGLENTHFSNPVGYDSNDNYSSARDLALIGRYIYRKDFVRQAAVIKKTEITSLDGKIKHKLESTNELLGDPDFTIKGLKTGTTERAGGCFVSIIENKNGHDILIVVLNSPNRFKETKTLADWIFKTFTW